jgi:hypothetical protein
MNRSIFVWMVMLLIGIDVMVATAAQRPPADATAPMPGSVDCEWLIDLWVEGDETGEARTWFRYVAYRAAMRFGYPGRLNPLIYAGWSLEEQIAWQRDPGRMIRDAIINTVLADAALRGWVVRIQVVPIVPTLYAIFAMLYTTERLNARTLTSKTLRQLAITEEDIKRLGPTVTEDAMYRLAWAHTTENAPLEKFWWELNDFIVQWAPPRTKPVLDGRGSQRPVREFTYRGVHALAGAALTALDDSLQRDRESPDHSRKASVNRTSRHRWCTSNPNDRQPLLQHLTMIMQQEDVVACSPALRGTVTLHATTLHQTSSKTITAHRGQYEFAARTPLSQGIRAYTNSPLHWATYTPNDTQWYCVTLRYNLEEDPNPYVWNPPLPLITTMSGCDLATQAFTRVHVPAKASAHHDSRQVDEFKQPPTPFTCIPHGGGWQHIGVSRDGSWPIGWHHGFLNQTSPPSDVHALIVETTEFGMPGQTTCLGARAPSWDVLLAAVRFVSQQPQDRVAARIKGGPEAYVAWVNEQLGLD